MIKNRAERATRRALNVIWNAAGRYHFDPGFFAFHADGSADDYFNLVIGCAVKWLGEERLGRILSAFAGSREAEEIGELLWLGIENWVYERELPERPVMRALRTARAELFFKEEQTLTRQQMEMQSMLVYRQMQYRFAEVSGRPLPLLGGRQKQLAEALRLSGEKSADEAESILVMIPETYLRAERGEKRARAGLLAKLHGRLTSHAYRHPELLIVRPGGAEKDEEKAVHVSWERRARRRTDAQAAEDLSYIRSTFGPSVIPEEERLSLERALAVGEDADCHLWAAAPQNEKMHERNLAYAREHRQLIEGEVKSLASEIELFLMSFLKALPETGRRGRLMPERAWRIGVLRDPKVFLSDGEEYDNPLRVTLLIDASRSRARSQEQIAAEAYIVAEALERNRVPVSVLSFRSLRGYTVLEELKKEGEESRGVFRYYAGGWNRDALVLRAAGMLMDRNEKTAGAEALRLMLVLTDASPNDTTPLALSGKAYEGEPAAAAAAEAVKLLRENGILTAALFHGATAHLENVYRIYGKEYVRIRSIKQLPGGAADLIAMTLREHLG